MSSTFPSLRNLLTDIFTTLPTQQEETPPSALPPTTLKPTLLTLHILFPNELLPALDLLDRNLLTKLVLEETPNEQDLQTEQRSINTFQNQNNQQPTPQIKHSPSKTRPQVYYIRSSQQQSYNPRHGPSENQQTTHYEVRPQAWNCSCPAFVFSAFPTTNSSPPDHPPMKRPDQSMRERSSADEEGNEWYFGGYSLGEDIPMCKHLLACVMVERWREFGHDVEEKEVSIEELAGWGAGWGG